MLPEDTNILVVVPNAAICNPVCICVGIGVGVGVGIGVGVGVGVGVGSGVGVGTILGICNIRPVNASRVIICKLYELSITVCINPFALLVAEPY